MDSCPHPNQRVVNEYVIVISHVSFIKTVHLKDGSNQEHLPYIISSSFDLLIEPMLIFIPERWITDQ